MFNSTEMQAESGSEAAMAPVAKTGSIKVHLPNNGFNIVKFIDNINVKVGYLYKISRVFNILYIPTARWYNPKTNLIFVKILLF